VSCIFSPESQSGRVRRKWFRLYYQKEIFGKQKCEPKVLETPLGEVVIVCFGVQWTGANSKVYSVLFASVGVRQIYAMPDHFDDLVIKQFCEEDPTKLSRLVIMGRFNVGVTVLPNIFASLSYRYMKMG